MAYCSILTNAWSEFVKGIIPTILVMGMARPLFRARLLLATTNLVNVPNDERLFLGNDQATATGLSFIMFIQRTAKLGDKNL